MLADQPRPQRGQCTSTVSGVTVVIASLLRAERKWGRYTALAAQNSLSSVPRRESPVPNRGRLDHREPSPARPCRGPGYGRDRFRGWFDAYRQGNGCNKPPPLSHHDSAETGKVARPSCDRPQIGAQLGRIALAAVAAV